MVSVITRAGLAAAGVRSPDGMVKPGEAMIMSDDECCWVICSGRTPHALLTDALVLYSGAR